MRNQSSTSMGQDQPSAESQQHVQAILESKDAEIDYLQQQLQNLS